MAGVVVMAGEETMAKVGAMAMAGWARPTSRFSLETGVEAGDRLTDP